MAAGQQIARLYAEIGADTSGLKKGLQDTKKGLQDLTRDVKSSSEAYTKAIQGNTNITRTYANEFLNAMKQTGAGSGELDRAARSMGVFSKSELQAANTSVLLDRKVKELTQAVNSGSMTAAQAGTAFKNYANEIGASGTEFQKFVGGVKGALGTFALVAGAIAAVGVAAKKAFDLGKEGAAIQQTQESFDRLVESLGQSPAYIDRLRDASRGTVSDLTLMSSTMTLLAGVSDDLGKELLGAAPRILEIAKAANKLNPTLGDTSYLYESLMTGIKRGSPLLIDNTGLTLKLGDANAAMAEKLGKSVEQLTAEEQKMAILNATLEAGSTLIQQVGGDVGSATDEFARFETNAANLSNTLKSKTVPAISDLVAGANALFSILEKGVDKNSFRDLELAALRIAKVSQPWNTAVTKRTATLQEERKEFQTQEQYLNRLIRSYETYARIRGHPENIAYAEPIEDMVNAYRELTDANQDFGYSLGLTANDLEYWRYALSVAESEALQATETVGKLQGVAASLEGQSWISNDALQRLERIGDATEEAAGAAEDFRTEWERIEELDFRDISKEIEALFDNKQAEEAGKGVVQSVYEGIKSSPFLPPGVAEQKFKDLYNVDQIINENLGNVDASEAERNISENLGVPLEEAKEKADEIREALRNMAAEQYIIEVVLKGTYTGPSIPGQTFGGPVPGYNPPQGTRALGGPVMADNSYLVGERGPELFVPNTSGYIIPNNALGNTSWSNPAAAAYGGGGQQVMYYSNYNDYYIYDEGAAALALAEQSMVKRNRLNASMGL